MGIKQYNNNGDKGPTNTTYTPISFSNPEGKIAQSRFSISYFNKVMKISIALKNNNNTNGGFATYDNDNAINVYLSNMKAKILCELLELLENDDTVHNVCVESKNGLFKISDGTEYGVDTYCFSILYAREDGSTNEIIYETKNNIHSGAYNYNNGAFEPKVFANLEYEALKMTLHQYWKASSYAVAASVMEANMYKQNSTYTILKSIADKVGASTGSNQQHSNKSFLSNNQAMNTSTIPKEYETSSFDDIANSLS